MGTARLVVQDHLVKQVDKFKKGTRNLQGVQSQARIYKECTVKKVEVVSKRGKRPLAVTYEGAGAATASEPAKLEADAVIVTLPLGVLQQSVEAPEDRKADVEAPEDSEDRKQAAIEFQPELSEKKRSAIHNIGMGLENKVLLRWDECDEANKPWLKKLQKLKYFQVPDPKYRLLSLHSMGDKSKRGCLLVHIAPPHAQKTHERDGELEDYKNYRVTKDVMVLLRSVFGDDVVREPAEAKVTGWHRDPFALGAYSYMRAGSTTQDKCVPPPRTNACHG